MEYMSGCIIKCQVNKTCGLVYVSEDFCHMLGFSREEIQEQYQDALLSLVLTEDRERVYWQLRNAYSVYLNDTQGGLRIFLEFQMYTKQQVPLDVTANMRFQEEDGDAYITAVITEVAKVSKINQQLIAMADSFPGGNCLLRMDQDMTVLYGNNAFYEICGYSREQMQRELYNKMIGAIYEEDIPSFFETIYEAWSQKKKGFETEIRMRETGSPARRVLMKGNFLKEDVVLQRDRVRDRTKNPVINCMLLDITRRFRDESDIHHCHERMDMLTKHGNTVLFEYFFRSKVLKQPKNMAAYFDLPESVPNAPQVLLDTGVIHPDSEEDVRDIFQRILSDATTISCVIHTQSKRGEQKWFRVTMSVVCDENQKPVRALGMAEDVTACKEAEAARNREKQYRHAMLSDTEAYAEINLSQDNLECLTGIWSEEIFPAVGCSYTYHFSSQLHKHIYQQDRNEYAKRFSPEALREAFSNNIKEISYEYRRIDSRGKITWVEGTVHLLREYPSQDIKAIAYLKDIDQKKKEDMTLRYQSKRDFLTGTYNKGAAEGKITAFLEEDGTSGKHALLIIDLDDFKTINDMRGHVFGDWVLSEVSQKMRQVFRHDDIVGRVGGDEFVVFMKNISAIKQVEDKLDKICAVFDRGFGGSTRFSCSVGVSIYPDDATEFDELYQKADIALYEAKKSTTNCCEIYQLMEKRDDFVPYRYQKQASIIMAEQKMEVLEPKMPVMDASLESDSIEKCLECIEQAWDSEDFSLAVMEDIGKRYEAETVFLLLYDAEHHVWYMDREWSAEGVAHIKEQWQTLSFAEDSFWMRAFYAKKDVRIPHSDQMFRHDINTCRFFQEQGILSLYAVPFLSNGTPDGYMGIINTQQDAPSLSTLKIFSTFISSEMGRRQVSQRLEYLCYHDEMTGLLNRNSYIRFANETDTSDWKSMGLLVVDINGLKQINQKYGRVKGDAVIKNIVGTFQRIMREATLFRQTGGEFVAICKNIAYSEFLRRIQLLKDTVAGMEGNGLSVGHVWKDTGIDIHEMARQADQMALLSKQQYHKESVENSNRQYRPESLKRLMHAIQQNQFEMYLQPKVDILTKKQIGAEALVRQNHPEYGVVLPGRFIPKLEQDRMVHFIDFFIFEEVCKTLNRWEKEGIPLMPISLNFSRVTLLEHDLIPILLSIQRKYQVPTHLIEIEITETIGEMEWDTLAEISDRFRKEGFKIILDDFGTKYTGMSLLSVIKFNVIKLDRSLVSHLVHNEDSQTVIHCIIDMCSRMDIQCVAEGVETEEQLEILRRLGCTWVQGYLFGKPMPVYSFETLWIESNKMIAEKSANFNTSMGYTL